MYCYSLRNGLVDTVTAYLKMIRRKNLRRLIVSDGNRQLESFDSR